MTTGHHGGAAPTTNIMSGLSPATLKKFFPDYLKKKKRKKKKAKR